MHEHHLIIRVGAGLIQFVYGSHSRMAADFTHGRGIDSKIQEIVSRWIQLLHNFYAIDTKDVRKQRDPGIKLLEVMTTSKLADKCIVK